MFNFQEIGSNNSSLEHDRWMLVYAVKWSIKQLNVTWKGSFVS
jgi:hypothetical protein